MPYKDRATKRRYQREWLRKRREQWLNENGPCVDCGSSSELQVDHEDPHLKSSHRIWSYSKAKRDVELAKCKVRCRMCHQAKTRAEGSYNQRTPYQRFVPRNISEAYEAAQENECLNQVVPPLASISAECSLPS